jgi:hypothetical protein
MAQNGQFGEAATADVILIASWRDEFGATVSPEAGIPENG